MPEILAYCGYRCDLCPAYEDNLESEADRERVRRDWSKYYDYEAALDEIACEGCPQASEAPNPSCPVRPCAIEKGVQHCGQCEDYICDSLRTRLDAIKPIAAKHGEGMPAEDHARYIHPYEAEERLRKLRDEPRSDSDC